MSIKFVRRLVLVSPLLFALAGCLGFGGGSGSVAPHLKQLPAAAQAQLAARGMTVEAPLFIRIFKEESELEIWKLKDGRFEHFKTYPICAWSGELGPKIVQGDKQAPEGFYTVTPGQMNPNSQFHLAFNLGYPNSYERANNRTGSALMVHGQCKSAGCYAMTDALIEEIFILAREAFAAGQTKFHVHAFPFRMTEENMRRYTGHKWYGFWRTLKEGYDAFEISRKPPVIKVCQSQYLVNVEFMGFTGEPEASGPCPLYTKLDPDKVPGFDGIPQTMLAGLNKPSVPQPVQAQQTGGPTVLASLMPGGAVEQAPLAPAPPYAQAQSALSAQSMSASASPVLMRSQPGRAQPSTQHALPGQAAMPQASPLPVHGTVLASMQPQPNAPQMAPAPAPIVAQQPYQAALIIPPPPGYESEVRQGPGLNTAQASSPPQQPQQYPSGAMTQAEGDGQKPRRSGKGGKLSVQGVQDNASQQAQIPQQGLGGQPVLPDSAISYGYTNGSLR